MPVPAGGGTVYTPDLLATRADLAALLQIDEADIPQATADALLAAATAVVQAAAGQRLVEVVNDEAVLDLDEYDGGRWLDLPERPVTAVESATVGVTVVTDYSAQLHRSRLYRADGWRSTILPYGDAPSTVTVVYSHGYAAGDPRLQLAKAAALQLAAAAFTNPAGAVREQIDDYSVQYDTAVATMEAPGTLAAALRRQYGGRQHGSVRLVRVR